MGTQASASSNDTVGALAINHSIVVGVLVAEPERRTLPSGSVAMSFSLTVRDGATKTTSVPVTWYDPPRRTERWSVGEHIAVDGCVVRRFYRGRGGLGSSTEVVVEAAERVRHTAKVARLLARARRRLDTVSETLS